MADPAEPPPKPQSSKKRDVLDNLIATLNDNHYHDRAPDREASGDGVGQEAPLDDVDLMSKASKRCLFKSQETPEAAPYTEDQTAGTPSFLTPKTLKGVVGDGMAVTIALRKKKERKSLIRKGRAPPASRLLRSMS
jgi:hypothetical protein